MRSSVSVDDRGNFFIIRVADEFSVRTIRAIRNCIEEAMSLGHVFVAFDLSECTTLDSGGISIIVNTFKKLCKQGGGVYLISIPLKLKEALDSANLLSIIRAFENVEEVEKQFK